MANFFDGTVTKLQASDGTPLGTFDVGDGATGVKFDGIDVLVTANGENTVTKLRVQDGAILEKIDVGEGPFHLALAGVNFWTADFSNNTVSTTANVKVVGPRPLPPLP